MVKFVTPHEWAKDRTPHEWANHHIRVVTILIGLLLLCAYPVGVFGLTLLTARHDTPAPAASAPRPTPPGISGSGVVVSMNDTSMSVQHGAVAQIGLAAGTTAFPTPEPIRQRTRVGDQVVFYLTQPGGGPWTITSLRNEALEDMGQNPTLGRPAR